MAGKVKRMPTHVEWEKIRKENKRRAKEMKGKKAEKKGKDKEEEEKTRRVRRGLRALKEIKKYWSGIKLLIRRLPFQRVIKEIMQGMRADLHLQPMAMMALRRWEKLSSRPARTTKSMCTTCKTGYNHAKGHTAR